MSITSEIIPFGEFAPDQGEHLNPGLIRSAGMIPFAGSWIPEYPLLSNLSSNIIDASANYSCRGAIAVSLGDYLYQVYVGTNQKLFEVNSLGGGTWGVDEVTQIGTASYEVDSTGWHFLQFGTHLIAVPGVSYSTTNLSSVPTTWAATTAYVLTDFVQAVTPYKNIYFECTTAGTSGGSEPTWDTTVGNTTNDGTVVWTTRATGASSRIQWLGDTTSGGSGTGDAANLNPDIMWPGTGSFPDTQKEFQDLIDYSDNTIYHLKARFVAPIGRRVMLGHLLQENDPTDAIGVSGYHPNRVHWSATDDPTTFVDENINDANLSGFADLLDDWGPITGLSGGSDYALVFKARGIYRMSHGDVFQYQFQPIPNSYGTRWSHSIVRVGNDVYFWGPSGPCVYVGGEARVVELGLGRITRSLLDGTWITGADDLQNVELTQTDEHLLAAAHDPSNGTIAWSIPTTASTTHWTQILLYNYKDNRFSFIDRSSPVSGLGQNNTYLFSNPDTDDAFSTPRDLLVTYTEDVLSRNIVGGWGSGGTESQGDSSLLTGFIELQKDARTMIKRVRPIFSINSAETTIPTITVKVHSRDKPYGTATTTTAGATEDREGWYTTPSAPLRNFHQFEFTIDETDRDHIAEFEGYQVEYTLGGKR